MCLLAGLQLWAILTHDLEDGIALGRPAVTDDKECRTRVVDEKALHALRFVTQSQVKSRSLSSVLMFLGSAHLVRLIGGA